MTQHWLIGAWTQAFQAMLPALMAASAVLAIGLQHVIFFRRRAHDAAQFVAFMEVASDGILVHHQGTVLAANAVFCRLVGRSREAVIGCSVLQFPASETPVPILRHIIDGDPVTGAAQLDLASSDGSIRAATISTRLLTYKGLPVCALSFRDMTESKVTEARALHLANHDPLTDLVSAASFEELVARALAMGVHHGRPLAVVRLSIHRFRATKEELGDAAADRLLQLVASRLRESSDPDCVLARLGTNDFAMLLPRLQQPDEAAAAARDLLAILNKPYYLDGRMVLLTTSIGVAMHPADGHTPGTLLSNAWAALQRAKKEGVGRLCFFELDMDREMRRKVSMKADLRAAFTKRKLKLHYQPLMDCRTLTIAGYEALLRWDHPVHGAVSPAEFIPLAEEIGLIGEIGSWVLETACIEAAGWDTNAFVAVNLSPAQFLEPDLPGHVAEILARTGLPPSRLELEITEGMLIDDPQRAIEALRVLKEKGISISLDDFGTGYSSLRYLKRFSFDRIKIDKSFVQDIGVSTQADAFIDTIIWLARALHLQVTAEGVETLSQFEALRRRDCDVVQGFLFSRAVPASAIRGLYYDATLGRLMHAPEGNAKAKTRVRA